MQAAHPARRVSTWTLMCECRCVGETVRVWEAVGDCTLEVCVRELGRDYVCGCED